MKFPDTITVSLTQVELALAAEVGVWRTVRNMFKKTSNHGGPPTMEDKWRADVIGAIGECVVCKGLGIFWSDTRIRDDDISWGYEVKAAEKSHHNLLVQRLSEEKEKKLHDIPHILVIGEGPKYIIKGWLYGREARNVDKYWGTPPGSNRKDRDCFVIPQRDLYPMSTIPIPEEHQ